MLTSTCIRFPSLWYKYIRKEVRRAVGFPAALFYGEKDDYKHFQSTNEEIVFADLLSGVTYEVVADSVFKAVSDTQTPQGILALIRMPHYTLEDVMQGERTHLLLLESVQDPGNLGTMVRTGEGAGITGVIMNRTTVDLFNPKTIRSTMGSIYRVPYVIADDFVATLQELKAKGVSLYAAHLKGKKQYDAFDYTVPTGFMIGNEGNGLSDEVADAADTYIRIPMEGQVESLNAAISASLLMYECNRQRRKMHEDLV